jgi:hypothetical protein
MKLKKHLILTILKKECKNLILINDTNGGVYDTPFLFDILQKLLIIVIDKRV